MAELTLLETGQSSNIPIESPQGPQGPSSQRRTEYKTLRILVVGATGSGKSTFISAASKRDVGIGHGGDSCTKNCSSYPVSCLGDIKFELIDTPGFDDPHRDDFNILEEILKFLDNITGVIYCHRITDTTLIGDTKLNLEVIKAMCGEMFYPRVVICSTMWDVFPQNATQSMLEGHRARMEQLLATAYQEMMDYGAQYMEFHADQPDPHLEVLKVFAHQRRPPEMAIRKQLSRGQKLVETGSGHEIEKSRQQKTEDAMLQQQVLRDTARKQDQDTRRQNDNHSPASSAGSQHQKSSKWSPHGGERLRNAGRRLKHCLSRSDEQNDTHTVPSACRTKREPDRLVLSHVV